MNCRACGRRVRAQNAKRLCARCVEIDRDARRDAAQESDDE